VSAALLDGNVLVALADEAHVHHAAARTWFLRLRSPFATCPITQGTLLRVLLATRAASDVQTAREVLDGFTAHARHVFWSDSVSYGAVSLRGVQGHRQVTDAYLSALARHHGGRVVTLDGGLAALHADVAELIPR
jgi:toxin-antitoxin system PIN domain toxin